LATPTVRSQPQSPAHAASLAPPSPASTGQPGLWPNVLQSGPGVLPIKSASQSNSILPISFWIRYFENWSGDSIVALTIYIKRVEYTIVISLHGIRRDICVRAINNQSNQEIKTDAHQDGSYDHNASFRSFFRLCFFFIFIFLFNRCLLILLVLGHLPLANDHTGRLLQDRTYCFQLP